jgi:hypothetical protein
MSCCGDVEENFVINCLIYCLFKKILGLSDQKIYVLMWNVACSRDITNLHKFLTGSQRENDLKAEA